VQANFPEDVVQPPWVVAVVLEAAAMVEAAGVVEESVCFWPVGRPVKKENQ
jgi:hypothetical protein